MILMSRVLDGDTVECVFSVWRNELYVRRSIRISGIDAPEIKTEAGKLVKKVTENWIKSNVGLEVLVLDDDKFNNRVIGNLVGKNGNDLAKYLLVLQLVKPYDGGTRSWSDIELQHVVDRVNSINIDQLITGTQNVLSNDWIINNEEE